MYTSQKTDQSFKDNGGLVASGESEDFRSEPIKILVYPPKNKQFRFDGETNQIEIEPIQSVETENSSTLTPFLDQCSINPNSQFEFQSTPIKNGGSSTDGSIKVETVFKIDKDFSDSKLKQHCFLKGCKWSSDGLCLLTNSEDNVLRIFDLPEVNHIEKICVQIHSVLQTNEGGPVYDYSWYPKMNSYNPITCVFACTSQDSPIHLWDAYTGQLRATYQPINQYDEVMSAYSIAFSPDGTKIYSGFKKHLKIFDISQPGRVSEERNLKVKGNPVFQSNIISCICINPSLPSLYALGSYDKTIGIYSEPEGDLICILRGHSGGITQLLFSSNGHYLFSGGRKDDEILCWDIRNPGKIVFCVQRKVETQQKIQFDISPDQSYLITGTTDCQVKIFDIGDPKITSENTLKPELSWKAHGDCVNGVHFHPSLPMFASTSGQRHLPQFNENDEEITENKENIENCVKIWKYNLSS